MLHEPIDEADMDLNGCIAEKRGGRITHHETNQLQFWVYNNILGNDHRDGDHDGRHKRNVLFPRNHQIVNEKTLLG